MRMSGDGGGLGFFHKSVLTLFFVYLMLGNLPRIGSFSRLAGFPATEALLYATTIFGCIWYRIKMPRLLLLAGVVFLISWSAGVILHSDLPAGEHMMAFLYALRLSLIGISANYIGWIWSRTAGSEKVIRFYLLIAAVQILIGIGIYLAFPKSEYLWLFLARYGIGFSGDPHIRRLIGSILDPNFFGNLLVLPALFVASGIIAKRSRMQYLTLMLLLTAIALTYSRSSFLGLAISLLVLPSLIAFAYPRARGPGLTRMVCLYAFLGFASLILCLWHSEVPSRLFERFTEITTDPSALGRLYNAQIATSLLFSFPYMITGLGYNYIPYATATRDLVNLGFDQSLLMLCVTLGLPTAALAIAVVCRWAREALAYLWELDMQLFGSLGAYIVASVVMSFFNNLLLLPFYLFSVLPILSYAYWKGKSYGETY